MRTTVGRYCAELEPAIEAPSTSLRGNVVHGRYPVQRSAARRASGTLTGGGRESRSVSFLPRIGWTRDTPNVTDPETATQVVEQAPYWFAAVLGVLGVILGVFSKGVIDALSSRSRNRREDRLRFVADKREAYADLLTATYNLADAEHDSRLLVLQGRRLDAQSVTYGSELNAYDAAFDANEAASAAAIREVNRSTAVVEVLAPANVVEAAALLVSRSQHPHLLPRRLEAQNAYVDAVRADLGYNAIAHLPVIPFEEYIGLDDPDSGIEVD